MTEQVPDISSVISSLSGTIPEPADPSDAPEPEYQIAGDGKLWNEFWDTLSDSDNTSDSSSPRKYSIDEDVLNTLQQCDFGKPNVQVINTILRVFLVENIANLKKILRPRVKTLIDKYDKT